jgi:PRTRC genetic system protein B
VHIPRGRHRVQVETRTGDQMLIVPLPDLVFIGRGRSYYVFATKHPPTPHTPLFHAPCSNVYDSGAICLGNTPFPEATPATIATAIALFLSGSTFTAHLAQNRVQGAGQSHILQLWADLAARPSARFPLRALRPLATTLARMLS